MFPSRIKRCLSLGLGITSIFQVLYELLILLEKGLVQFVFVSSPKYFTKRKIIINTSRNNDLCVTGDLLLIDEQLIFTNKLKKSH